MAKHIRSKKLGKWKYTNSQNEVKEPNNVPKETQGNKGEKAISVDLALYALLIFLLLGKFGIIEAITNNWNTLEPYTFIITSIYVFLSFILRK